VAISVTLKIKLFSQSRCPTLVMRRLRVICWRFPIPWNRLQVTAVTRTPASNTFLSRASFWPLKVALQRNWTLLSSLRPTDSFESFSHSFFLYSENDQYFCSRSDIWRRWVSTLRYSLLRRPVVRWMAAISVLGTWQCKYKISIWASLLRHCCRRKAIITANLQCLFVALVIQHAMRMHHFCHL